MTPLEKEYQLVADIYDAALDGSRWPLVMRSIAELCEARSTIITGMDMLNPGYNILTPHNLSEACLSEYREAGWDELDMRLTGAAFHQFGGVGKAATLDDLFGSYQSWKDLVGDYYLYCRKWNMSAQVGVMLDLDDYRWCCLGVHRTEEEGHFGKDTVAFLDRMGLHLRRGLQIHRQLSLARQHNAALYALLQKMSVGVILLNTATQVVFANAAAELVLRQSNFLQVTRTGVKCSDPAHNARLQLLIRGAVETSLRDCQGDTGGVMGITHSSRPLPLILSILPLSAIDSWQDLRSDNVAAAVFVTDPDHGRRISETLLRENYKLSPREIEICQCFVNNPVLETLAPEVRLTRESLRTVLKGIYEKTGQHSQSELMRLLMGLSLEFQHIGGL